MHIAHFKKSMKCLMFREWEKYSSFSPNSILEHIGIQLILFIHAKASISLHPLSKALGSSTTILRHLEISLPVPLSLLDNFLHNLKFLRSVKLTDGRWS